MNHTIPFNKIAFIVTTIATASFNPASTRVTANSAALDSREQAAADPAQSQAANATPARKKYESVVLRGKVVELGTHLMQKYQVPIDDDSGKNLMVLLTDDGEVHPIIKDLRSRGYWMDKRLRDRPMELHVHKFPGLPFVRLVDAYSIKDDKKYRIDYWCSICAITTFEPGPCPCCQDEIELREVPE